MTGRPPRAAGLPALAVSLAAALAVGALGGWITAGSVTTWYPTLAKPAFTPPDRVFGPVWTLLYILMAIAAWRVWRSGRPGRRRALVLHAGQLALNLLWSVVFFGLHSVGGALAEILVLWLALMATTTAFFRVDRTAGLLMLPYVAWVAFAILLNFGIWWLA